MKNYTIAVNGKAYAVTVEEGAVSGIAATPAAPAAPAAPTVPAPAPTVASALAAAPAGAADSVSVSASVSGKVAVVKAAVGQAVKKDDATLVLEVMKMESDIVAPQDGTIASTNASIDDSVKSDAVLATLN